MTDGIKGIFVVPFITFFLADVLIWHHPLFYQATSHGQVFDTDIVGIFSPSMVTSAVNVYV